MRVTKTIGYKINEKGKRVQVQKQFYGKNKTEINRKIAEWEAQQSKGITQKEEDANILFDIWIYEFLANDSSLALSTRNLYIDVYERFLKNADFLYQNLRSITSANLQSFINGLNAPYSRLKKLLTVIKKFYVYAEMNGYANNITNSIVIPKPNYSYEDEDEDGENIIVWEDWEIERIFSFRRVDPRFRIRFLIYILYFTGLRISEALALKYSDFDLENKTLKVRRQVIRAGKITRERERGSLTVGKLKSPSSYRTLPLPDVIIPELLNHIEWQKKDMEENEYETEYLFTTKKGLFYDVTNIRRAFERYYDRVRVPYKRIHTYRHTFASNLARTSQIKIVSKLLGHSDITITAKYYVATNMEDERNAINSISINPEDSEN